MKFALIIVSLLCLQTRAYSQDNFYNAVLCELSMHSIYIVVNVESSDYTGKATIENESLYSFFYKTRGFDEKQYRSYVRKVLTDNTKIHLENTDLDKWFFKKTKIIESVENNAKKGKEIFISQYFTNRLIKKDINEEVENAVITKLFEWKIATQTDDESGMLFFTIPDEKWMRTNQFCCNN